MPLNIDLQQVFLHLLNVAILFAALYFILYKPVRRFMEARREEYEERESRTQEELRAAEQSRADYEEKLANAQEEISKMREMARAETRAEREKRLTAAQAEADRIVATAQNTAHTERERILADAQKEIAQIVTDATEKIAVEGDTSAAYESFLKTVEGERRDA